MTPAPFFLQDSAGPRQIVCDLPMTQRGPAEEAGFGLRGQHIAGKECAEISHFDIDLKNNSGGNDIAIGWMDQLGWINVLDSIF